MPTTHTSSKDLPLPVRIFRAAMEQQRSLADYAHSLDISADSLRAIITAQLDQIEPGALDRLADIYQQSHETLRDQLSITAPQESFAAWLKRNMEGISQQALRTRVQLDSKTLKRFLNGEMLPDSDQSERLARALYIDRTELARVVTATMIHQARAEHLADTTDTSADRQMPLLAITEEPGTIRSQRTRRQKATSHTEQNATERPAANGSPKTADRVREPQTEPEADIARRPAANGSPKTADRVREPQIEPEADIARRPAAGRRAGTKTATPPSPATTTPPINPVPAPEIDHARQTAADRQAGATTAEVSDITTLQLTVDEVRLIRHWRQLHPHGRRATLHYIGSLLVDD